MNRWIVKTRSGKRTMEIDPKKHTLVAGQLYNIKTGKLIGEVAQWIGFPAKEAK